MLLFLLGAFVLYIVVRLAAQHGVTDATQGRLSRERYKAFEQMIESGNLPHATATATDDPEAP